MRPGPRGDRRDRHATGWRRRCGRRRRCCGGRRRHAGESRRGGDGRLRRRRDARDWRRGWQQWVLIGRDRRSRVRQRRRQRRGPPAAPISFDRISYGPIRSISPPPNGAACRPSSTTWDCWQPTAMTSRPGTLSFCTWTPRPSPTRRSASRRFIVGPDGHARRQRAKMQFVIAFRPNRHEGEIPRRLEAHPRHAPRRRELPHDRLAFNVLSAGSGIAPPAARRARSSPQRRLLRALRQRGAQRPRVHHASLSGRTRRRSVEGRRPAETNHDRRRAAAPGCSTGRPRHRERCRRSST